MRTCAAHLVADSLVAGGYTHDPWSPKSWLMTTAQHYFSLLYGDVYAFISDPALTGAACLVLMVVAFWMVIIIAIIRH